MPIGKGRALDYVEHEWGTYVDRFQRLPPEEQTKRLRQTGYESLRDLLAHSSGLAEYFPFYKDHAGRAEFERAICRAPHEYPGQGPTMTIASMVFDLQNQVMHVAPGQPNRSEYQPVGLPAAASR